MDIQLHTYGSQVLTEVAHLEIARIPVSAAHMVRDRMGAPYQSDAAVARWSGSFIVPASRLCGMRAAPPLVMPFELVICQRGASIRGHWSDIPAILELLERMVPVLVVEPMIQRVR